MSKPHIKNWLPKLNKISDFTARNAVANARFIFPIDTDDKSLNNYLIKFDQILNAFKKEFPEENDLEKTLRLKRWLAENGLPIREALALLTIREARLGNYGAAVKAFEANDAELGKATRKQRSSFGKGSHQGQAKKLAHDRQKYQELANKFWEGNKSLSKRGVASLLYKKLASMPIDQRPCEIKSERSIRSYIKKL